MQSESYRSAGWAALASALLFLPIMGLLIYHDVQAHPALGSGESDINLMAAIISLDVLSKVFGIFAILRFRHLLNQRYDFHAVDHLIVIQVVLGLALGVFSYLMRFIESNVAVIGIMVSLGLVFGIVGIVYATRLLRVPGTLNGLLKPLAYLNMIGSICFLTFFLAPIGLILFVVCNILLGMLFLSREGELEEVEFV